MLPGIDPARVTDWLIDVAGAVPPVKFAAVGDGQSNFSYRASDDAGNLWVLRRPPLGELAQSAHDVAREYRIQSHLAATDVPVPAMIALCEDPAICDAPIVLMEHVEGMVLDNADQVAATSPEVRRAAGLSMAATLAQIHDVDLEATGLTDLASHSPYAPRQIRRWLRQWDGVKTHENPLVEDLAERLRKSTPEQSDLTLVHGDFHMLNVILNPTAGTVRAVLDWELSTLGDPLADLGSLLAYWPQQTDASIFSMFSMTLAPGFPSREELISCYAKESGRDVSDVGFWHALGYWKVAIIAEGIRHRSIDEPQNGEPMAIAQIDGLLDRAVQTADEAGI